MKVRKEIITHKCDKCGREFEVTGTIKFSSSNPWHLYRGSGRPWQDRNRLRLCKKHFKEFEAKLRKLIYEY